MQNPTAPNDGWSEMSVIFAIPMILRMLLVAVGVFVIFSGSNGYKMESHEPRSWHKISPQDASLYFSQDEMRFFTDSNYSQSCRGECCLSQSRRGPNFEFEPKDSHLKLFLTPEDFKNRRFKTFGLKDVFELMIRNGKEVLGTFGDSLSTQLAFFSNCMMKRDNASLKSKPRKMFITDTIVEFYSYESDIPGLEKSAKLIASKVHEVKEDLSEVNWIFQHVNPDIFVFNLGYHFNPKTIIPTIDNFFQRLRENMNGNQILIFRESNAVNFASKCGYRPNEATPCGFFSYDRYSDPECDFQNLNWYDAMESHGFEIQHAFAPRTYTNVTNTIFVVPWYEASQSRADLNKGYYFNADKDKYLYDCLHYRYSPQIFGVVWEGLYRALKLAGLS